MYIEIQKDGKQYNAVFGCFFGLTIINYWLEETITSVNAPFQIFFGHRY